MPCFPLNRLSAFGFCLLSFVFCLSSFFFTLPAAAQRIIPTSARMMAVDELGNAYVVRTDNTLTRYNEHGDSAAFYRAISNGDIGAVDASNPLEVLVYFPKQSRIVLLDRMLTPKTELDLRRLRLFMPPAVAMSADGNIWVYDPFNARVRKITEDLTELTQTNDLRQQTGFVPAPSYMTERDRRLYLVDTTNGILLFDRYGTYLNALPVKGITMLQAVGSQLIYRNGDSLVAYNTESFAEKKMALPPAPGLLQALIGHEHLYLLYTDRLEIRDMPR